MIYIYLFIIISKKKDSISNDLFDNIFEHLCLGVYFDFYKSHKLNSIRLREYSNPNDDM